MEKPTRPRILIIDDDERLLQALRRLHGKRYDITTCAEAVRAIQVVQREGPFAAVVCDYQMPVLNGAMCLAKIQDAQPEVVRVLLTGNHDLDTAVDAINRGAIFRFLQKPCDAESFRRCVDDAVRQHELLAAERDLLRDTLSGSVQVLSEVLSLTNPAAFGRAARVQHCVRELLCESRCEQAWEIETAAMLFELGLIAVPQEIIERQARGEPLNPEQRAMLGRHPTIGSGLLANIPRMQGVARIIQYQSKHFDGSGMPPGEEASAQIPYGARVLSAAAAFEDRRAEGQTPAEAVAAMADDAGRFDPEVLDLLARSHPIEDHAQNQVVSVRRLIPGYVLDQDIVHQSGSLLVPKGQRITDSMIARLRSYADLGHIDAEVSVLVSAGASGTPPARV